MAKLAYPGDRRDEYVDEDDARLALIFLNEGEDRINIVTMFRDAGLSLGEACNIYHAALWLQKNESRNK